MGTFGVIPPHSVTYMEAACSFNEPIELHPFAFRTHAHTHGQSLVNTGETLKSCFLLSKTSETFVYFSVYRLFRFSYLSGLLLRFYCSIVYWLACWTFSWEIWGSNSRQDRNCLGFLLRLHPIYPILWEDQTTRKRVLFLPRCDCDMFEFWNLFWSFGLDVCRLLRFCVTLVR